MKLFRTILMALLSLLIYSAAVSHAGHALDRPGQPSGLSAGTYLMASDAGIITHVNPASIVPIINTPVIQKKDNPFAAVLSGHDLKCDRALHSPGYFLHTHRRKQAEKFTLYPFHSFW